MHAAVITFPGSNRDTDIARALRRAGAKVTMVEAFAPAAEAEPGEEAAGGEQHAGADVGALPAAVREREHERDRLDEVRRERVEQERALLQRLLRAVGEGLVKAPLGGLGPPVGGEDDLLDRRLGHRRGTGY